MEQPNVTLTYAYNKGDARQSMTDSFGTVGCTTYVLATLTGKVGSNEELTVSGSTSSWPVPPNPTARRPDT